MSSVFVETERQKINPPCRRTEQAGMPRGKLLRNLGRKMRLDFDGLTKAMSHPFAPG